MPMFSSGWKMGSCEHFYLFCSLPLDEMKWFPSVNTCIFYNKGQSIRQYLKDILRVASAMYKGHAISRRYVLHLFDLDSYV